MSPTADAEGGADNGAPDGPERSELRVAEIEAANGLIQFDAGMHLVRTYVDEKRPFALRPSMILQLHAIALDGLDANAGRWRGTPVGIHKSDHSPPPPHLVENLITEMCDHVNDYWHERSAFYLASYIMWKLNWIHPFSDGNGRTSRIVSYVVLCLKLGYELPGKPTIVEQIQADRTKYFHALQEADRAHRDGIDDLSAMEALLKGMLAEQLLSVIEKAEQGS